MRKLSLVIEEIDIHEGSELSISCCSKILDFDFWSFQELFCVWTEYEFQEMMNEKKIYLNLFIKSKTIIWQKQHFLVENRAAH